MPARIVSLADAVVGRINAAELDGVTAVRRWLPAAELDKLQSPAVTVTPATEARVARDRGSQSRTYGIDVGVQRRVTTEGEHDGMASLVESISALFGPGTRLAECAWRESQIEPVCEPEHLRANRVFTSVLTLRFLDLTR